MRGSQEEIEGLRFSVFFAQEGFVRRVFQQAAHQVGHPREDLPHRGVNPDTSSGLGDGGLKRFGHSEDHLVFSGIRRQPRRFRRSLGMRQAAQAMRAERGSDEAGVLDQRPAEEFVVVIRLRFGFKDRDRPTPLPVTDRVGVPIRPLDQPDRDRGAALPHPSDQAVEVGGRLRQVSLHGDAAMGIAAVGVFGQEAHKDHQRQILQLRLFHIERDRGR